MKRKRFNKDISKIEGTIGHVFDAHIEELMACKSIEVLRSLVSRLFADSNISTCKSRQLEWKLSHAGLADGMQYVVNTWFAAKKMGVY